jgi:hypothetical protein
MADAALARRDGYAAPADRPTQRRMAEADDVPRGYVRAEAPRVVARAAADGTEETCHIGFASRTEVGYEMYDMYGPYTEVVSLDAFDKTLSTNPLVEYVLNHGRNGGPPMAHTRNGTLVLGVEKAGDETGLTYDANVDNSRNDVSDTSKALKRGDLAEASFKFRIVRGQWSPDYTEYRIEEVDLERGDVSAVNFGANPLATSAIRDQQHARALDAEDVNMLTQALGWFAAIDNIIDPIADGDPADGTALAIDAIVDNAQMALATYLGVPNPDADSDTDSEPVEASASAGRRVRTVHDFEVEHRH